MIKTTLTHPTAPVEAVDRAVALGLFDGIHLGHRRVISGAVGMRHLRTAVFSFDRAAAALKRDAFTLCSDTRTAHLLDVLGVAEWFEASFDAYRDLSPEAFVRDVLVAQLHAKAVFCGFNFRFGKHGAGDAAQLTTLCAAYGITVTVADELSDEGGTISSDRIRRLIEAGDILEASRLLGHSFVIDTPVSHGQALGRTLGSPTANQILPDGFVRPRFGVYASTAVIDGKAYYGITNIGMRPTVGAPAPLAETWFEDYAGDLYDRPLNVVLTRFLRDEKKFDSVDALTAQIFADREAARAARQEDTVKAVLFDFDDTLQHRPTALERYAAFFLDRYAPSFSEDERRDATVTLMAMNNGGYVNYLDYFTAMPKALGIADPPDAATLFAEYQRVFPSFVCLFEDSVATLQALRAKGLLCGVVTNGPLVQQHRKLDVAGIRPLLDTVLVSTEEEIAKPNPEIFRRAAARLGLSPHQCLFVGDHPLNDIAGAVDTGMHPVFIDTRLPDAGQDGVPVIHTPYDVVGLV